MENPGKGYVGILEKNFSKMIVLYRLFNSLFPLSWLLNRGGKGSSSGSSTDNNDDYDYDSSYDSGDSGDGGSFGGGGAGRDF